MCVSSIQKEVPNVPHLEVIFTSRLKISRARMCNKAYVTYIKLQIGFLH